MVDWVTASAVEQVWGLWEFRLSPDEREVLYADLARVGKAPSPSRWVQMSCRCLACCQARGDLTGPKGNENVEKVSFRADFSGV